MASDATLRSIEYSSGPQKDATVAAKNAVRLLKRLEMLAFSMSIPKHELVKALTELKAKYQCDDDEKDEGNDDVPIASLNDNQNEAQNVSYGKENSATEDDFSVYEDAMTF